MLQSNQKTGTFENAQTLLRRNCMRGESTVMKKKKTTLPSNFQELLAKSDIDSLKQVFESCEIDAVYSEYYGGNAFAMTPLLKEFAVWLKEQGADIEMRNRYGQTPLFKHASAYNGNVDLLIALGADVNATSADTAPHRFTMRPPVYGLRP